MKTLKNIREEMNLTFAEISEKIGITEDYYRKIESGVRNPSYNFITKFKAAFPYLNIDEIFFKHK